MISIFSYRITFVDFIVGVILIYFALQMYDTISTFLASDINVYIDNNLVVESVTSIISTLLISTKKIPWFITPEILKAQQELTKMYNSLDKDSDLYKFLTKHCKYLLEPLEGDCPISLDLGTSPVYFITDKKTATEIGTYFVTNSMGIYVFSEDSKNLSTMYIGSSRSLTTRPLHHYTSSLKPNVSGDFYLFIKSLGGIQNFKYQVLHSVPSFTDIWKNEKGTLPNQHNNSILMAFSSFYVGVLEQALLSHYNTGLNKSKVVKYPSIYWMKKHGTVSLYFMESRSKKVNNLNINTCFDFSIYYDYCNWKGIEPLSVDWLEYIIGFSEARGCWVKRWNKHSLEFSMKDVEYLQVLVDLLELTALVNTEYNRLTINDLSDLEVILTLFLPSGNLLSNQFKNDFLNYIQNNSYGNINSSIPYSKGMVTKDNYWLSGYMDGKSMFYFTIITNNSVKGLNIRPVIKITCSSCELAKEIKDLFPLSRISTKESHIVQFTSVKAALSMVNYLEQYPLRIKQDIQVWFKSIIKLMEAGQHRSTDATIISNIKTLIKNRPE